METKEELWGKAFDLMVNCAGAGRMPVSDMKVVSRLATMLTKEEEARFDKEVADEVHARYHSILASSEEDESESGGGSESDDSDALACRGSDMNDFVATFEDIERMNLLMNKMLACSSEKRRSERKAKRKRKGDHGAAVTATIPAAVASSAATPAASTNTTTTTAAGSGPVAATVVSTNAAPLFVRSVPIGEKRQPPPVPIRKSSRRNTTI
ncbi:m29.1 protein [Murid betaherpesvirus 1]|uniref:M29.1 protein n=1 Tax=Murid herpesvirus 1 TaxID=10366 RepID=H2A0S2_MUHV1|nr:m29.1 protein [Murid betaherpesvirus 1]